MNKKYYFSDIIARQLCVITTVIIFREVRYSVRHVPIKDFGEQAGCGIFPAAEYFCPIALSAP
jgi:hypothetical protein